MATMKTLTTNSNPPSVTTITMIAIITIMTTIIKRKTINMVIPMLLRLSTIPSRVKVKATLRATIRRIITIEERKESIITNRIIRKKDIRIINSHNRRGRLIRKWKWITHQRK